MLKSTGITCSALQTLLHCSPRIERSTRPSQQAPEWWATSWSQSTANYQPCCCHSTHESGVRHQWPQSPSSKRQRIFRFRWQGRELAALIPFWTEAACRSKRRSTIISQAVNRRAIVIVFYRTNRVVNIHDTDWEPGIKFLYAISDVATTQQVVVSKLKVDHNHRNTETMCTGGLENREFISNNVHKSQWNCSGLYHTDMYQTLFGHRTLPTSICTSWSTSLL